MAANKQKDDGQANLEDEWHNPFMQGMGKIGDEVNILLNVEKLLYDEELEPLQQVSATESQAQ